MADGQKYATGKYNRCNDDMDGVQRRVAEEVGSVGGVATHMTHLRHLGGAGLFVPDQSLTHTHQLWNAPH